MADVFDFYIQDDRKIIFEIAEPIMREDNEVTDFQFHVPKALNGLDMTGWAWWFVFVNAKGNKYTEPLLLSDDPERPLEYSVGTYTVDYGMSIKAGDVSFALEAINSDTGGTILNEWHTFTYQTTVRETLQGNQVDYDETQSDVISALLIEVQKKVNQLIGGATPTPVSAVSEMLDTDKLYLLTTDGEWYYYNGTAWVSGGVYGAGVVDPVPTQGSANAVSSGGVKSALDAVTAQIPAIDSTLTQEGQAADAKTVGDAIANENKKALAAFATDTASGSIAHFTDGADNIPLKDVLVHIEPVQAGSGDPSPDNVRPITGWTGAKVTRCGKNIFLPARTSGTTTNAGITFTYNADGSVTANGTATATAFSIAYDRVGLTFHLPPGRYVKSGANGNIDGLLVQYIDPAVPSQWVTISSFGSTSFTITEEQSKCDIIVRVRISSGKTLEDEVYKPYIAFESSGSDYEPYVGSTYSITFPSEAGTVYGGTLDVTSGVLTVDRQYIELNGTNYIFTLMSQDTYPYTYVFTNRTLSNRLAINNANEITKTLCNYFPSISRTDAALSGGNKTGIFQYHGTTNELRIAFPLEDRFSTWDKLKAWIQSLEIPFVICIPLKEPLTTYQLTPQEITSLLGENNLWADTGDTEVEYRADVTKYIDRKITEAVSALT